MSLSSPQHAQCQDVLAHYISSPFHKTNRNSHLLLFLLLHLCEPQGQATAWEPSPQHHSSKHIQAVTCTQFQDRRVPALSKAALERRNCPWFFFFFPSRTNVVKRDLRTSSLWGWWSPGTGCPVRLWSLLLWRYSRPAWTRSYADCCRCPCFGRRVGLDDPQRSLPTPTILWFCDSIYLFLLESP